MKTVRHEEYVRFEDDLPFYFQPNIVRTPKLCSTSQNWHENIELQLCLCGRGEVLLDGEKYPFEEGDVIVVPPNVIHYTTTDSSLGYACLIADNDFCESVGFDVRNVNFAPRITGNSTLNALFAELGNVFTESDELRKPRLNLIFIKIFLELYGCRTAARTAKKAPGRFEEVKNAVVFIRENYASKLTLDDVAKAVLTDKFTLAKEFRKITGQTVITYLNGYRCRQAAALISDGASVAGAAYECGFENASYFTRLYKTVTGSLPSSLKKSESE